MARWFRCRLGLLPTLSVAGALMSITLLRFHLPLIKPDVRISRIRLSDKDSCFRPRNVAVRQTKLDQAKLLMQRFVRDSVKCPSLHLVLLTQPPTEPVAGMFGDDPVRFAHGPVAEVVAPIQP